jgi:hypothetical protein
MKIDAEKVLTIAGGFVVGVVALYAVRKVMDQQQAAKDVAANNVEDFGGMILDSNPWHGEGGQHFLPPNQFVGPSTVMPLRYPAISGQNLSVIAQHGFAPLFRQKPQDLDWLNYAPSEGA